MLNNDASEVLNNDRLYSFVLKYKFFLITFVASILLASLIYTLYDIQNLKNSKKDFLLYHKAISYIESNNTEKGLEIFNEIIEKNRSGYVNLVRIYKLQHFYKQNDDRLNDLNKIKKYSHIYAFLLYSLVISNNISLCDFKPEVKFKSLNDLRNFVHILTLVFNSNTSADKLKNDLLTLNNIKYLKGLMNIAIEVKNV